MAKLTERIFDFVVNIGLSPTRTPPKIVNKLLATVAVMLLLALVVSAFPTIKDRLYCSVSGFRSLSKSFGPDTIKNCAILLSSRLRLLSSS
jgi:hypothetical protein